MKRRNPRWGCPRIAQQIALAFAVDIDKDVVRRVLATHYRPAPPLGWSVLADDSWGMRKIACGASTCSGASRRPCEAIGCWS